MESKKCVVCGIEFVPKTRKQQCCSKKCAIDKASTERRKPYICQHCGNPFWRPNAFRMKFCSTDCQLASRREQHPSKAKTLPQIYKKECAWCGEPYETQIKNQVYCCKKCAYEADLKRLREKWSREYVPKNVTCKECGTEYMTECGDKHSVFCCQSCADKYKHRLEHQSARHKTYMREVKANREKQLAAAFVEAVAYDAVYHRDEGLCQVCGLPVVYDTSADQNWSGSIDHIVPLSCGGEHSMNNCQLAHRICNSLKCKNAGDYHIDWSVKAKENNYWRIKYEGYQSMLPQA